MRKPRPAASSSPIPALPQRAAPVLLGALLAAAGDAGAQSTDAGPVAIAAADAPDAAADAAVTDAAQPPPIEFVESHIRTGGAPAHHGACACDVPPVTSDGPHAAFVAAALAALVARRRRR